MSVPSAPPMDASANYSNNNNISSDNPATAVVISNPVLTPNPPAEPTLSGIQSIPIKKTLMLLNNFIINTTEFLNKFVSTAEGKLSNVEKQTQKLEILLALLEAKLNSINWLSGTSVSTAPIASNTESSVPSAPLISDESAAEKEENPEVPASVAAVAPVAEVIPIKDDSRYHKWFKFLGMRIPKEQLKQRMVIEAPNLNPDMLDLDPMTPAPDGAVHISSTQQLVVVAQEDSDSEKSES